MNRICIFCGRSFDPYPTVPDQRYCSRSECQKARRRKWQKEKLAADKALEPIKLIVRVPGGKEILTTGDIIAKRTRHTLNGTGSSSDSAIAGSDNHQETDP